MTVLSLLANSISIESQCGSKYTISPVPFLNRGVAEDLCNAVGELCKDTKLSEMEGGHYFRVKTTMDVTIPLCRGWKISLKNGETSWVSFKYERLPIICYWCGCLNDANKDYDKWIESNGTLNPEDREYGPWIRASPFVMPQKTVIKVLGYYEALKKEKGLKTKSHEHPATINLADSSPATQNQGTRRTEPAASINDDTL
uniref:Zinc knuckle CX2CX4HX4C domain-containing protein n=1 Tax=Quercus lobata TaxID=97700 RepID=A0A7N2N6F3_QUELO